MSSWPTGFMLIQGNRMEELRSLMVAWMRRYPLRPLENEVILVQSNGIGQWLKLALAARPAEDEGGLGVAAGIELLLPGQFVWRVYRAVLGELPEHSPFDKGPLAFRLYRLLRLWAKPEAAPLGPEHLQALSPLRPLLPDGSGASAEQRCYRLASQIADLFDQYQVYRADWLAAWSQGQDVIYRADGKEEPLPADQAWQPALWRLLSEEIRGAAHRHPLAQASRAEVHRAFLQAAKDLKRLQAAPLPRRLIVFGISALPQQTLEVLEAVAQVAQTMVFVLNPSRYYWGDLIAGRDLFRQPYRRQRARKFPEGLDEQELHLYGHPLLAAWGRQGRDYLRLLDARDERARYEAHFSGLYAGGVDLFVSPGTDCLLHQLQDDILELRSLKERQALNTVIDPKQDLSLEFMIAHSRQREIEVLHDRLLAEFDSAAEDKRPLEPRDVLVMVPDIAPYVPHIQAVFGRLDPDDPRYIPFQIADLSERRQNPLMRGLMRLLELPHLRLSASELLDWLEIPAFRARFGLEGSQVIQLRRWIAEANIRWGLDAEQRASLELPGLEQYSWRFGLRRLLLGFANGNSGPWQGIEPVDLVGGLEAALLGPLAEIIESLAHYWRLMREPHPASDWIELIGSLIDAFFIETSEAEGIALGRLMQALEGWSADCIRGGLGAEPLPYAVFRDSFLTYLEQPRLGQHFVGGSVHFATLMPMRAIPFRQIWILGLNDGDYPRRHLTPGFDLMGTDYRPGDRSRREDDRYLFLEALLSAREKLVIGWVGRDIRNNSQREPSVLVAQLRDHIAAGWRLPNGQDGSVADALTTLYPLQPFSRTYFDFASRRSPQVFTYADEWRAAQAVEDQGPTQRRLDPWLPETALDLAQLESFLRSPIESLFKQRLRLPEPDDEEPPEDTEPFDPRPLERWYIRQALIDWCLIPGLDQAGFERCLEQGIGRLQAQGRLLAGPLGETLGRQAAAGLSELYTAWSQALATWPEPMAQGLRVRHTLELSEGRLILEDGLSDLRRNRSGIGQVICQASELGSGRQRSWHKAIRAWVRHLAAQLGEGSVETRLLTPKGTLTLRPLDPEEARARLNDLLLAWWQGMHEPLPVTLGSAIAWIEEGGAAPESTAIAPDLEKDPRQRPAWSKAAERFKEESERSAYLRACYEDFAALWSNGAFAYWAHRLYAPMLQCAS